MSAFGRRSGANGSGGGRPSFGTAQPMKGPVTPQSPEGGKQFPPIEPESLDLDDASSAAPSALDRGDAMARLADRQAQSGEQGNSKVEGFEASHPQLVQVVNRIAVTLSNMGI